MFLLQSLKYIFSRIRPFEEAVLPALALSQDKIIFSISLGKILPRPTSMRVPAIILTMLYKNPFPVTSMHIKF